LVIGTGAGIGGNIAKRFVREGDRARSASPFKLHLHAHSDLK
jgi:NAD(P)-dependent dehydrogenase (short-subunit alcohol dehydrogenase family)